jgi:hypothetical protein
MREPTAHKLQELVKLHAPPEASGYCFTRTTPDNEVLRYPPSGCWKLSPFHVPFGVPNGVYTVYFFRQIEDRTPQAPKNPLNPFPQVPFFAPTGEEGPPADQTASSPAKADTTATAVATRPASSHDEIKRLRAELHAELERQPAVRDTRVEYLQRQLALELQEQNQDLLKYGHYVAEVGGQFQLNRAYRMESQQAMETVLGLAKRTAEDAQTMMSVFRGMQELQVEALVSIKKQVAVLASPPPPPPPADYSGTATAAVNLLRDVSVALIQLKAGPSARPPELPAANRGEVHTAEIHSKGQSSGAALPATEPVSGSPVPSSAPPVSSTPSEPLSPAAPPEPAPAVPAPPIAPPVAAAPVVAPPPTTRSPVASLPTAQPSSPAAAALSVPTPTQPAEPAVPTAQPPATNPAPAVPPVAVPTPPLPVPTSAPTPSPARPAQEPLIPASPSTPAADAAMSKPQASDDGPPAEPALGLAEKLITTAMEYQRLDAAVDSGVAASAPLPEVNAPKVEPPRSPLVNAPSPLVTPSAASPTSAPASQKEPLRQSAGAGWLGVLRWMFTSQKSAIEQRMSALRGKGKE